MGGTPRLGTISWADLTVEDADRLRDFYSAVAGWSPEPLPMGGYADYVMNDAGGAAAAGICHARGSNADLPPQWIVYITVDDLNHSLSECIRLGGSLLTQPRSYADGRFCIIKDPAGAVCALYEASTAA